MSEEGLRKIAKEEMSKSIMDNLDSVLIFTYIKSLEKENKLMKKELDKCSKHIVPCMFETSKDYISKSKIQEIVEKSYNDIDYFKGDILKDLEELLKE